METRSALLGLMVYPAHKFRYFTKIGPTLWPFSPQPSLPHPHFGL